MKTIFDRPTVVWPTNTPREPAVQKEIDTFLTALDSYPEGFARNPYLSFEQHLFSVVTMKGFLAHREGE